MYFVFNLYVSSRSTELYLEYFSKNTPGRSIREKFVFVMLFLSECALTEKNLGSKKISNSGKTY